MLVFEWQAGRLCINTSERQKTLLHVLGTPTDFATLLRTQGRFKKLWGLLQGILMGPSKHVYNNNLFC